MKRLYSTAFVKPLKNRKKSAFFVINSLYTYTRLSHPFARHVFGYTQKESHDGETESRNADRGGLAPCLSSAVGGLIERYSDIAPEIDIIAYRSGYQGVLLGERIEITKDMREKAHLLHRYGGSPIGNSRVKLTNAADCAKRGLVKEGDNPLRVAAERLAADGITILHTIGGDDTNTTAADLAAYLGANGYDLTVVGLPKTVDNDVVPIKQSLGA